MGMMSAVKTDGVSSPGAAACSAAAVQLWSHAPAQVLLACPGVMKTDRTIVVLHREIRVKIIELHTSVERVLMSYLESFRCEFWLLTDRAQMLLTGCARDTQVQQTIPQSPHF